MSWFSSHLLGTTAFITLRDGIGFGGANADELCRDIDRADRVELAINSAGGCCRTANALFTALKGRCPRAVITGTAASCAALIMLAADTVQIAADGHVMLHPPRATIFATAPELRESAAYLDSIADNWIARVTERTRRPIAEVVQWFAGPDRWFSAADAKAVHLVDEILAPVADSVAD